MRRKSQIVDFNGNFLDLLSQIERDLRKWTKLEGIIKLPFRKWINCTLCKSTSKFSVNIQRIMKSELLFVARWPEDWPRVNLPCPSFGRLFCLWSRIPCRHGRRSSVVFLTSYELSFMHFRLCETQWSDSLSKPICKFNGLRPTAIA